MVAPDVERVDWVLLVYRVPREPSSPRIAIWRRLRALGVGQLADGVVALPEDARTREHLEWVADRVDDAGGTALLLRAQALSRKDERAMARRMSEARAAEYDDLAARARALADATDSEPERRRALKRLRSDLRAVTRRDHFPPPQRREAVAAVNDAAATVVGARPARTPIDRVGHPA